MKKIAVSFTIMFCCVMSYSQQTISVDASSLAESTTTSAVDFSKSFVLSFVKNKSNARTEIRIADDDGIFQTLKKGISINEEPQFDLLFNSKNGQKLVVKKSDGKDLELSPTDFIQISIAEGNKSKEIKIPKSPSQSAPPPGGDEDLAPVKAQHAVGIELHDAILARKFYDELDQQQFFTLLAKIKGVSSSDPSVIKELYKGNKFILDLLTDTKIKEFKDKGAGVQVGFLGSLASKALSADVTTIADGFARFLVKRTKEELSVAFFQRFKDLLNDAKYKDAQILFPTTLNVLNAIDQEIYQLENYITTLREAFEQDLSLLLENTPDVIKEGRHKDYFTAHPNLKYSILLSLFSARELTTGTHPGKILEALPEEYIEGFVKANKTQDKNISGAFKVAQLISMSIRSQGSSSYWTSVDSLQMLYKNDESLITARFYFGFLYEKANLIAFDKKTFQDYLNLAAGSLPDIKKYILFVKQLGKEYTNIEAALAQVKLKAPETPSIDVYNRLFNAFANGFSELVKVEELPHIVIDGRITEEIKKYITGFKECNDLALNVVRKNYGSAIVNSYNIYLLATAGLDTTTEKDIVKKVREFIRKYGNFMANTVKAKNSEEVAAAIEAAALPVGSASIKRQTPVNIALNGYVGFFGGSERIKGVDDGYKFNAYGVTAPIGISISLRNSAVRKKNSSSSSLFLSIVDLGAPVAFRFKDDKTESIPSIQLKDIISPGIFYSFGIPRLPISINAGWQMGPVLRKIDPSVATTASSKYSRLSLSFVVDIPLLNFYSKTD